MDGPVNGGPSAVLTRLADAHRGNPAVARCDCSREAKVYVDRNGQGFNEVRGIRCRLGSDLFVRQFCYRMGATESTELNVCLFATAAKVCAAASGVEYFSANFIRHEKSHSCEFDLRTNEG